MGKGHQHTQAGLISLPVEAKEEFVPSQHWEAAFPRCFGCTGGKAEAGVYEFCRRSLGPEGH